MNLFNRRQFGVVVMLGMAAIAGAGTAFAEPAKGVPEAIAKKGELVVGLEGTYPPLTIRTSPANSSASTSISPTRFANASA
ncbi:hypothetical protein [Shinella sp. NM-101]|uniref:hypothetical protein n=1 Tax=Shinella sp. NM-101 TaxID=2744455 RepID=UPI001F36B3BC|nr:hypothetical protein [Shinella sp. NM-101]